MAAWRPSRPCPSTPRLHLGCEAGEMGTRAKQLQNICVTADICRLQPCPWQALYIKPLPRCNPNSKRSPRQDSHGPSPNSRHPRVCPAAAMRAHLWSAQPCAPPAPPRLQAVSRASEPPHSTPVSQCVAMLEGAAGKGPAAVPFRDTTPPPPTASPCE